MRILGIESSCDETGVAVYDTEAGLLANRLHSQVDMHRDYGGVVPELASRDHIRRVVPLVEETLPVSGCSLADIGLVAVTQGPGLGGALLVGTSFAAGLGLALGKPVVPIHHLEGHLLSPLMAKPSPSFPFVALLVSGGHTHLMKVESVGRYELLGDTVDDAAGEAFDKTATLLGLGYPGGAALSRLAEKGQAAQFAFPRPMLRSGDLDFSFSGLKTAVLTTIASLGGPSALTDSTRADLAASFEAAVTEVLVTKALRALESTGLSQLVVAGGVGANRRLREQLNAQLSRRGARAFFPPLELCTDNGAMIAHAAALRVTTLRESNATRIDSFGVRPRWTLGSA